MSLLGFGLFISECWGLIGLTRMAFDCGHEMRSMPFLGPGAFLGTHPLEPGGGGIHQHPEGVIGMATTCEDNSRVVPKSHSEWSVVIGSRRMARIAGM
jgi:hypothetical protein